MSVLVGVIRDVSSVFPWCMGGSVGDLGGVVVSSEGEVGERWAMSSRMDLRLAGWYMGMYFLRNFLLLSVCLPDPSILMRC